MPKPSSEQVRAIVQTYFKLEEVIHFPCSPPDQREELKMISYRLMMQCHELILPGKTTIWAANMVGSVLAAGMMAATEMQHIKTHTAALKVFGLAGDYPCLPARALAEVRPYANEAVIPPAVVQQIEDRTRTRLFRLPDSPTPVDVLVALTRHHHSRFAALVARQIAERFRDPGADALNPYVLAYLKSFANLKAINEKDGWGDVLSDVISGTPVPTADEWAVVLKGRIPEGRLRTRASYAATRRFIVDYWSRCHVEPSEKKVRESLDSSSAQV